MKRGVALALKAWDHPRMKLTFELREVGPKELAAMTGLSPAMQRDWRRAGHIPKTDDGWASFDLPAVAAIALRKAFVDARFGPSFAEAILADPIAPRVINSIVWFMVEADEWWVAPGVAQAVNAAATNRAASVDQIAGVALRDTGRLLVLSPADQQYSLKNQLDSPDFIGGVVVQMTVDLAELARRVVGGAEAPLIRVTGEAT